ncbi:uncharacterized protein LOC121727366 [Aricia agestis]|uniref:uncharacterized protein LOC121727366 n=1 Tax=Aricia agestis TaxID=91739 RepID=UPI001C2057FB|nr:uncharacterized protein LOC121727366 [Aricia agestis]
MKSLPILFGLIFCLVSVSGRNLNENLGNEEQSEGESAQPARDPTAKQLMRHRRRSRQSFYDYNYDYRRDHSRQQDETYNQIIRLLDEIAYNLRRQSPPPPPPQQPIYVPYPVPYYVPQYIGCNSNANNTNIPSGFFNRWPEMDDERQNFGLVPAETDTGDNDGIRPISFDPIPPATSAVKPPPVEHGSSQAGMEDKKTTQVKQPGICKAAVLNCCNFRSNEDQRSCFLKHDCRKTYETGLACKPEVVKRVLQEFAEAYAPVTNEDRIIWPRLGQSNSFW